ncbi:hypothetical protein ACJJTC_007279 [Scirpophaga incertulas]
MREKMSVLMCGVFLCYFIGFVGAELHDECECGIEASSNPLHRNPWTVLLEFYRRGQLTEFRCGGTLIDRQHILTAAHCIKKIKYHRLLVRVGDYNLDAEEDCIGDVCNDVPVWRAVTQAVPHPGQDREHDVAVLRLNKPVPCTDYIRPVCLPSGTANESLTFTAAGWGEDVVTGRYSDVKKSISLPFLPYYVCQNLYKHDVIPKQAICAGGEKGVDTCRGDSGGPLTAQLDHVELYGVTSLGPTVCGREGEPAIYTSVFDHLVWIKEVVGLT